MEDKTNINRIARLVGRISRASNKDNVCIIFSDSQSNHFCQCLNSLGATIIIKVSDSSDKILGFWERVYNYEQKFELPIIIQLFPTSRKGEYEYGLIDNNAPDKEPRHVPLGPQVQEFVTELINYFEYIS